MTRCRVYDTDCLNPAYCAAHDACCAGDPACKPVQIIEGEHRFELTSLPDGIRLSRPVIVDGPLGSRRMANVCIADMTRAEARALGEALLLAAADA